jgi:hypothetical protein
LERVARVSFARKQAAFDAADTAAAFDRIRRQNPGWEPTPIEEPEKREGVTPEDMDATLSELRALQSQSEE